MSLNFADLGKFAVMSLLFYSKLRLLTGWDIHDRPEQLCHVNGTETSKLGKSSSFSYAMFCLVKCRLLQRKSMILTLLNLFIKEY